MSVSMRPCPTKPCPLLLTALEVTRQAQNSGKSQILHKYGNHGQTFRLFYDQKQAETRIVPTQSYSVLSLTC